MSELSDNPSLKEIYAYKKKINWGDIPSIYQLASNSISEIDGILSHGFNNAFTQLLDQSNWNVNFKTSESDIVGKVTTPKPKISLYHNINEQHYELHCYPVINNESVLEAQYNNPRCSFIEWTPQTMQILFRLNSLIPFIVYTLQKGDIADYALIRYANQRVDELITLLSQSFDITDIKGFSIADFCKEVYRKHSQS
ncbi:hypothetical protein [Cognaticolwellia beringensis]|uniref:Uncharacterized protein n=1 Tax=Cognaticolwellia beringensis TaxID=1967665 RepID=A0A222GCY4_9GAMM|nr:hypothetical protein [Cognaticolwellia beringensis]ASP49728.1 hypothetical protein B5D82_19305 [Cognaticolwellia beringensis]